MKRLFLISIIGLFSLSLFSQKDYWIFFTDKNGVEFNPYTYFSQKAIDRRIKLGIDLYDISDFPVNENYIQQVKIIVNEADISLRWMNALAVVATDEQLELVKKLPFVKSIRAMETEMTLTGESISESTSKLSDYESFTLYRQIDRMQGNEFIKNGVNGKGVRIAIFDGGFPGYKNHPAFEHIRNENRIIDTWNFAKKQKDVDWGISHGTATFSCVGGMYENQNVGLATGAEFLLAITEVKAEPFKEEKWWMAAVEWADKNGADIISSSLGYGFQRYFPEQMDGHQSLVAEAARIATRKGILVVNSAGNEGSNSWETIITPSDVDSVLCVGGIFPDQDFHTSFSSFGPAANGVLKPNVIAYGHVLAATIKGYNLTQGTSFSCPLTAGFAACAWQTNRNLTNMDLFKKMEQSGDLFPYFDYAHGYGVPQASYFLMKTEKAVEPTFVIENAGDSITIRVKEDYIQKGSMYNNQLFYNFQGTDGILNEYNVIAVYRTEALKIDKSEKRQKGTKLNVHYKGYTQSIEL